MKKLIFLIIMLSTTVSMAATNVSFRWQPNVEPDLAGYRVWRSATSGGPYTMIGEIPCGPSDSTCAEFTEMGVPDGTYFWVATAHDTEGFQSDYSNEATDTLDSTAPAPPQNLTIWQKILAWIESGSGKMYGWIMKFLETS